MAGIVTRAAAVAVPVESTFRREIKAEDERDIRTILSDDFGRDIDRRQPPGN